MKAEFPQDLKQMFTTARGDLQHLKQELDRVQTMISTDRLIPDSLYLNIVSSLERCRNSKLTLTDSMEKYAVSMDVPMAEMEQAVQEALAGAEIRALLLDYFRLTSDAEAVLIKLNESKRELKDQCTRPDGDLKTALDPYRIIVDYVSGKTDEITDEESEIIEETMSRTISRALDKGQIRFGDPADGEKWLEDIPGIPKASPKPSAEENAVSGTIAEEGSASEKEGPEPETEESVEDASAITPAVAEEPAEETTLETEASPVQTESANRAPAGDDSREEPEALWPGFHGYTEPGTVSMEDVSAGTFHTKDYNGMFQNNTIHPYVLRVYLDTRLFPADAEEQAFHSVGLNSKKEAEYLRRHGYLAIVHFTEPDGSVSDYYAPSSKEYAAIANKKVQDEYRRRQIVEDFKSVRKPSAFSTLYFQRCKLFIDWFQNCSNRLADDLRPKVSLGDQSDDFVFESFSGIDTENSFLVPAVFERGREMETIAIVTEAIERYKDDCRIIFIVKDLEDIRPLTETVCADHPEYFEYLCFTAPGVDKYFDGHGEQIAVGLDDGVQTEAPFPDPEKPGEAGKTSFPPEGEAAGDGSQEKPGERGAKEEPAPAASEEDGEAEEPVPPVPEEDGAAGEPVSTASEERGAAEGTAPTASEERGAAEEPVTPVPGENGAPEEPVQPVPEEPETNSAEGIPSREPVQPLTPEEAVPESVPFKKSLDAAGIRSAVQKYEKKAYEAFASGRNDIGSVLLKSLCIETDHMADLIPEHDRLVTKNAWYSFATGDPMQQKDYRVSHLQTVFSAPFGHDEAYDALAIAAYLRMYFSADAGLEPFGAASVQFPDNMMLKNIPSLNDVLYRLADYMKSAFSGINSQALSSVFDHGSANDKLEKARQEAAGWFVDNRLTSSKHANRRIIENRKLLFGGNSPITAALETIAENRITDPEPVKQAMKLVSDRATPQNIENMMDETWDKTAYGKDRASLVGAERNTLKKQLINIYQIFTDWLEAVQANRDIADGESAALRQTLPYIRDKLISSVKAFGTLKKAESVEAYGARLILKNTMTELLERFTTPDIKERHEWDYYIRLLEHPLVAVVDGFVPYIETPAEETSPFNFCERAVRYLELPKVELPDIIARLFRKSADRVGGDYGCAGVLRDYLELTDRLEIWPPEYASIQRFVEDAQNPRSKAVDAVQGWQQDFQGRLDLADGDEWFREPDERKRLQEIIKLQQCSYCFMNNFGFYGRAMLRVLENMSLEAEMLRSEYREQLAQVQAANSIAPDAPIYTLASGMIEKNRFGAFRSYLQMAERGETDVSESRLSDQKSYFATFSRQCADYCYKTRLTRDTTLQSVFRHSGYQQNATGKTGMILVQNWPESASSNPQTQAMKVRNIAEALGLQVEAQYSAGSGVHLDLKDPGQVVNYPHPIADFGSKMYQRGLRVHAFYGNLTADVLVSKVRETLQKNSQNSFLILVNCALSLQERRKLSRLVASGMMQSPFIILDRALALYLATIPQAERWKALLQCALPFQIINPYSENSAVEIPPEMFIGRARELDSIRNPEGANLIYGGRQLGKTALLKRARVLEHRVAEQSWAVYEDIKNKTGADASARIAKTLTQEKFFTRLPDVNSWEALMDAIENRLMEHESRRLLLLLDEADIFLAAAGQDGYAEIDEVKHLQDRTRGRFKCVMAGLHNVLRLNNKRALTNNSSLAHLQGLTVEPLDFKDARALLEIPLSYLGFTIPEEDEDIITQILYNTNYFPGLVHFYASRLVEYARTHANEMKEPPYELNKDTLLSLLAEKDFHDLRNDRIRMTLYIDANEHSYYDILATTLCYGYNISEDYKLLGMTAEDIRRECCEITPKCSIGRLNDAQLKALLDELVALNIFRTENGRYLFRRASFTEIFDSPEAVEQHFLEILEREAE